MTGTQKGLTEHLRQEEGGQKGGRRGQAGGKTTVGAVPFAPWIPTAQVRHLFLPPLGQAPWTWGQDGAYLMVALEGTVSLQSSSELPQVLSSSALGSFKVIVKP